MVQLVPVKVILGLLAAVGYPVSTHITYANTDGRTGKQRVEEAGCSTPGNCHIA